MIKKSTVIKGSVFLATLLVGVAIFVWILFKTGPAETLATLQGFGFLPFVGFVVISLTNFALLSWRWKLILDHHSTPSEHLSLWTIARHRMSGFAMSYLTPSAQVGGEPLRIALLHQSGIPLRPASSSVILDVAFEIAGFITYITFGLILSLFLHLLPPDAKWTIGIGLFIVGGLLIAFFLSTFLKGGFFSTMLRWFIPRRRQTTSPTLKALLDVETLMGTFLRTNPLLSLGVFLISCITVAFRAVEIIYLGFFFGVSVSLLHAILLSTLPGLALLVPIPSALGVLEGSTAGVIALIGVPLNAIALVLIIRLRDVLFILLGVVHLGGSLQTWLRKKELPET